MHCESDQSGPVLAISANSCRVTTTLGIRSRWSQRQQDEPRAHGDSRCHRPLVRGLALFQSATSSSSCMTRCSQALAVVASGATVQQT